MANETKNKAQAVRDYLKRHKNAKPSEVVKALAEQDITVNASYVIQVKSLSKQKRSSKKDNFSAEIPFRQGGTMVIP